jgi:hypothetical protein
MTYTGDGEIGTGGSADVSDAPRVAGASVVGAGGCTSGLGGVTACSRAFDSGAGLRASCAGGIGHM